MANPQLELLKESIEHRIKSIDSRRLHYRRQSFYAFISTAVLASITTIILGLQLQGKWIETTRITALIITTFITFINTYNAFFNHKDLWVANNNALNKFYELKFNIEYFEKGGQIQDNNLIDTFKQSYQAILDELNLTWHNARTVVQRPEA